MLTPQLLQAVFSAVALGSVYALVSLGFTLVYQATETFNFAHAALVAVGAYLVVAGTSQFHLAFPYAAGLAIAASTAIGVVLGELLVGPLSARSRLSPDLALIALSVVLAAGVGLVFGPGMRKIAPPFEDVALEWRGVVFPAPLLMQTAASWLGVALVGLLLRATSLGLLIRAGSEGQEAARQADVDLAAMRRLAFAIGGFCVGLGGVALGQRDGVSADLQGFAMLALPAAAIGGLGSLRGAIFGGLLVGAIQSFAAAEGASRLGEVFVYVALLAVLIVRPRGLFSNREWGRA